MFAAWIVDDTGGSIDPIGIIANGRLQEARRVDTEENFHADVVAFVHRFYAVGRHYSLLRNGEKVGAVTVLSPPLDDMLGDGCVSLAASVAVKLEQAPAGRLPPVHESEVDPSLEARLLRLARATLTSGGIREELVDRVKLGSSLVFHLTTSSRNWVAASFEVDSVPPEANRADRRILLFVIGRSSGETYRIEYSNFQDTDVAEARRIEPIGVLDIDGDGTMELFTRSLSYEGWTYAVRARSDSAWVTHQRGGGGC